MKGTTIVFFLFVSLLIFSCEKEEFSTQASTTESKIDFRSGQLPNGKGLQKINDNQVNPRLERGLGVSLPLFSEEAVTVKTGTWVTLAFSIQGPLNEGACPNGLTSEQVDDIVSGANQFVADRGLEIEFNGESIDVPPYFRAEDIVLFTDDAGNCRYALLWRYYVNPQSPGEYEFKNSISGIEFTRTIIWEPGKEEE